MALMEVTCRCGWTVRGTERQVISGIRAHARREHDLAMSAGDVRAIWHAVDADGARPSRRDGEG